MAKEKEEGEKNFQQRARADFKSIVNHLNFHKMKKAILKVFGGAALVAGMMYNVQVFDTGSISDISLAALGNAAVAQSENPYNFRYESPGMVYSSSCGCYIWVTNCPTGPGYC